MPARPSAIDAAAIAACRHVPMVTHHYAARATVACCRDCGATATPVHWPTAANPPTSTTDAINAFRQEFGHAD